MDIQCIAPMVQSGLAAMGLTEKTNPKAPEILQAYAKLLLEKNQVMNLTAITEPSEVANLHFLDSAALLLAEDLSSGPILDVGTGAGFPGLVLAILKPDLQVTLMDALEKRIFWLQETADALQASNAVSVHARAEEAAKKPGVRESFAVVTSRAVADLRILSELCLPFVRMGGSFLAMKGSQSQAETEAALHAIEELGGSLERTIPYTIPGTDVSHAVLVIRKVQPTPERYPRRWAVLQRKPL